MKEQDLHIKLRETGEDSLLEKVHEDILVLLEHASNSGKTIPLEVSLLLKEPNFENYFKAHELLCEALNPATPETIRYMAQFKNKKTIFSGNIPLVRNFILFAFLAIICLIASGLSPEVNEVTLSKGILNNSGLSLFQNLIFLCSASAIGAVFFILSNLTRKVKNASLSASDSTYYWSMLIMGMLSGLIMSEVIVLNQDINSESVEMNRLLFALLGGFSSETVFSILHGLMSRIKVVMSGEP